MNPQVKIDEESFGLNEAPNQTGSPERRLLLGVLERAILDYVGNDAKESASAEAWLFGANKDNPEFTFEWVCEELDLDREKVSALIKAMPKRGKHKVAPWYFTKRIKQSAAKENKRRMTQRESQNRIFATLDSRNRSGVSVN